MVQGFFIETDSTLMIRDHKMLALLNKTDRNRLTQISET